MAANKLVALSFSSKMLDFEGRISHIVLAERETFVFVKPISWEREWAKLNAQVEDLFPLDNLSDAKPGKRFLNSNKWLGKGKLNMCSPILSR